MSNHLRSASVAFLLACLATLHAADDAVWIEGEQPAQAAPELWKPAAPEHADRVSGGKWLALQVAAAKAEQSIPESGAVAGWDFSVARDGRYQIWERYGLESIRSPFEWRLDAGEWARIPAKAQPYVDLMDLAVWCEISWTRLGDADLKAGAHRIELRVQRPEKPKDPKAKTPDALHFVDCFCIAPSFRPDGRHRPGEDWMSDDDRKAAAQVFTLPPAQGDERVSTPLGGLWQVARWDEFQPADRTGPDKELPPLDVLPWSAIPVPGDKNHTRPELGLAHRLVYRTRVQVPADLAGHAFVLHCPGVNLIASAYANGVFCGWTRAMCTDWDCDLTPGIKPGAVNEIAVVIKDTHYALSPEKAHAAWSGLALTPVGLIHQSWVCQNMDFPVADVSVSGFLEAPTLLACGGVYASDVFAKPSVAKQQLALDVTLTNPGAAEATARLEVAIEPVAAAGEHPAPEKTFAAQEVKLAPHASQLVALSEAWADAKLWWPDDPRLYRAVTRVTVAGAPVDVRRTTFGFREWGWGSDQFTLNGIPWHFRADTSGVGGSLERQLAYWRSHDQNMVRMCAWENGGAGSQGTLDYFDRTGMVARHSSIFDGMGAQYLRGLSDPALFQHWTEYLEAWGRAERNHPSLLIYSIENEIAFINSRNLGQMGTVEPLLAKGAKALMAVDPTRPVMVDGGRCLKNEELPVNGCHYDEAAWREYPDEAYTYELAAKSHQIAWNSWGASPWRLVPDRPIFHGEAYYLNGYQPGDLAQWGGDEAFTGWVGARRGGGLFAKILSEGYRWHGVAAFHFSLSEGQSGDYYNCWKPVIALCREWNWTFAGGQQVERSLKLLNDTHDPQPIELAWEVTVAGKRVAGETRSEQVPMGGAAPLSISFTLPMVKERTSAELTLSCRRGGQELFHDVKPMWLIDADGGPRPAFKPGELAVLDPKGAVAARLKARGIAFTAAASPEEIPDDARVVVVGPDALDAQQATSTRWLAIAARGGRVLVLDQQHPLHGAAVPAADLESKPFAGRVAFAENLAHPAFASLDQPDLFTWSKDHLVYREAYVKPTRGATSLAQCDLALGYSALVESHANDGLLMLCQLLVGTKLDGDAVAQRLFDNLLGYCADYRPVKKPTAMILDPASLRGRLVDEVGLAYDRAADPLAAIKGGKAEIVLVDATPANLAALAGDPASVRAFTEKGGWLITWGLTPDGLAAFNKLVGVEHLIRPFRRERVMLPATRDPMLSGLGMKDVAMESGEKIASWAGQHYPASDGFTYVVDYDDIAPFCAYPDWKFFNPGKDKPDADKDPYNLVDGLTNADFWHFILQLPAKPPFLEWDVTMPREEQPTRFEVIDNGNYNLLDRIELTYNGAGDPIAIPLKPEKDVVQSFDLPERKATKIHVKLASWQGKDPATIGIDNWWIRVKRSPEFLARVEPLLNIGALVKYPQGKGGVLLCQLDVPEHEQNPENRRKRGALLATILRNLGAVFSGGRTIVAGAGLAYEPVPLNEACNLYITRAQGWFEDEKRDLAQFPVGESRFAGVSYLVRDFKTSPLPCAISLEGAKVQTALPAAVTGIAVGRKADALFFLHTCKPLKPWQAPKQGDATPPTLWTYVVHYADGQSATVPVRYGEGAAPWLQKEAKPLKGAAVAWASPAAGGEQAVVWQMQWTNPHPDAAIASIDVAYDAKAKAVYGVPVVLAITAATQAGTAK